MHATAQLHELLADLLGAANQRQMWAFYFAESGALMEPIMPMDELPAGPNALVDTDDWGSVQFARALSGRLKMIVELIGAASCVLVWERCGGAHPTPVDIEWASALDEYLRADGVALRAQFLLHDAGLGILNSNDLRRNS